MYAIVEIGGQQFKVEEGKKIFVNKLEAEEGKSLEFDRVLLLEDSDKIMVGEPVLNDLVVEGKVLANVKGDKVIVFKKKNKKGYRVKNGHRQSFTQVEIVRIGEKGAAPKPSARKTAAKTPENEAVAVPVVEAEAKVAVKKAAPKKAEKKDAEAKPKKASAEKEPAKKPAARKTSKSKE